MVGKAHTSDILLFKVSFYDFLIFLTQVWYILEWTRNNNIKSNNFRNSVHEA